VAYSLATNVANSTYTSSLEACSAVKALNESGYRPFEGWLALVLMAASMRPTMRRTLFFCAFQDVELPEEGVGAKGAAAAPAPCIEFTEIYGGSQGTCCFASKSPGKGALLAKCSEF
jgi:hypothetical protein